MKFSNHFFLLNYIVTNYDSLLTDLILIDSFNKFEPFISSDKYILWHTTNIGTNLNEKQLVTGVIPLKNIKSKPQKYYLNILINNNSDFLPLAFYDIFFQKIKICVILTGFMRNFKITMPLFNNYFKNYQVDYYVCTYDIIGMGSYQSENYTQEKFNIDDLKNIVNVKKYIIKDYSKCEKVDNDIHINKIYYQTLNIFDCFNSIDENYFFYIRLRPDLTFENLDTILLEHFNDIVNNKILVHGPKFTCIEDEWVIKQTDCPFDGFAICNIFTAEIYFKFHQEIHTYKDSPEQTLYYYLKNKGIDLVTDKICQINRMNISAPLNRIAVLRKK
jgi:hypothetical protein